MIILSGCKKLVRREAVKGEGAASRGGPLQRIARLAAEARQRLRLRFVDVEDGDELRDGQHVVDLGRQVEQLVQGLPSD